MKSFLNTGEVEEEENRKFTNKINQHGFPGVSNNWNFEILNIKAEYFIKTMTTNVNLLQVYCISVMDLSLYVIWYTS